MPRRSATCLTCVPALGPVLGALAAVGACSPAGQPSAPIERGQAHFVAPLSTPSFPTGALIGWNIGRGTLYGPAGDPLHPQWRTAEREAAFALLHEVRAPGGPRPQVRFSGLQIDGVLGGDGYHFERFVEPGHAPAPDDNMAPFQYMAIVDEIDADLLVTLNFGSGTASEAAQYVTHLVGTDPDEPQVAARAHWGRTEPYRPRAYELGNEIYGFWNTGFVDTGEFSYANPDASHGGDPDWVGRPAADPAAYAARALEYVAAVLAVDPPARFWVPLSQASMDAWGGMEAALAGLDPLLRHVAVEAVVVHHYQVDDAGALGLFDKESPELAIAGSEKFRGEYERLRTQLDALPREAPLAIAITEYHVAGAFALGGFDAMADTHRVGLGVADMLITFAQLGIEQAAQHMAIAFDGAAQTELLFESWYNPIEATGSDAFGRSSYVATKLVADHLRTQTIVLQPQDVPQARYVEGTQELPYPQVHAVGFWDEADEATLLVLSRSLTAEQSVSFDLPAGEGWTVTAARVYAPADLTSPAVRAELSTTELKFEEGGERVALTLPPHSLAAVTLGR